LETYLIYLIVVFFILLVIGLFTLPIISSLDYSNPSIIDIQDTEKKYVTKTQKVISENVTLGAVTFKKIDFSLSKGQTIKVQWSSTKQVSLVAMMKQSTFDSFYKSMALTLGTAGATAFFSSLSIPIVTSLLIPRLPDLLKSIGSIDYYILNSSRDSKTLNLEAGSYMAVVFGVLTGAGSSMIDVSYDYQILENVIKHRTVTQYPPKRITIWQWLVTKNSRKPTSAHDG